MSGIIRRLWVRHGLMAVAAGLAFQAGTALADGPAPIYTKNKLLRLPVQLEDRAKVSEIKLFVREPDGTTRCVQTGSATQSTFDFTASKDGEYRFTFATVDRQGRMLPADVEAVVPHRIVVVDTAPPEVSPQATSIKDGTLIQVSVKDTNINWATLRATYTASDGSSRTLTPDSADTPTVFRAPNPRGLNSKIYVTVADRASNRTVREVTVVPGAPPAAAPRTASPYARVEAGKPDPALFPNEERLPTGSAISPTPPMPPAGGGLDIELPKVPASGANPPTEIKLPDAPPVPSKGGMPDITVPDLPGTPPSRPREAVRPADVPKAPDDLRIPEPPPVPSTKNLDLPPVAPVKTPEPPPIKPTGGVSIPEPTIPLPEPKSSSFKPGDVAVPDVPALPDRSTPSPLPTASKSHPILNSRTCSINYQLDASARVARRIDFWATPDNGKSWVQLRDENGGASPAKLILPSDGVFGIRIRPGGGRKAPEPGEDPDCIVEVDTTKPAVRLSAPTLGSGDDEGIMVFAWEAADTNLVSNSISLYYAQKEEGPWKPIVAGHKNEGTYRWAMPANLLGPIFVRLEASDRAGNVGRHEISTPVTLEGGKSRVRVLEVGPAK